MKKHFLKITKKNIYFYFMFVFIIQFFIHSKSYAENLISWDNLDLDNNYAIFKINNLLYFFYGDGHITHSDPNFKIPQKEITLSFFYKPNNERKFKFCNDKEEDLTLIEQIKLVKNNEHLTKYFPFKEFYCLKIDIKTKENLENFYNPKNNNLSTLDLKRISCSTSSFIEKQLDIMTRREKYKNCMKNDK